MYNLIYQKFLQKFHFEHSLCPKIWEWTLVFSFTTDEEVKRTISQYFEEIKRTFNDNIKKHGQ